MEGKNLPALSWINLILAVVLLVSPWIFRFDTGAATTASLIGGLAIGLASALAITLSWQRNWAEAGAIFAYLNVVIGALVFFAPMMLKYNANNGETWIHTLAGIIVSVVATYQSVRIAEEGASQK